MLASPPVAVLVVLAESARHHTCANNVACMLRQRRCTAGACILLIGQCHVRCIPPGGHLEIWQTNMPKHESRSNRQMKAIFLLPLMINLTPFSQADSKQREGGGGGGAEGKTATVGKQACYVQKHY